MIANIPYFLIEFTVQTVFLLAALWIMIKLQKLEYNFLGLLGSAALVSGLDKILDMILGHFVGIYLACSISTPIVGTVLCLSIARVTGADRVDVLFTVGVGCALTFGMNLWLLGALLGDLRPSARSAGLEENVPGEMASEDSLAAQTNMAPPANQKRRELKARTISSMDAQRSAATVTNLVKPAPSRSEQIARDFTFKGLTRNSRQSALVVHTRVKTYTILYGELELMQTKLGVVPVRFEELGDDYVVLNVDGQPLKLSLR